ncbi:MBL fold metallo-hydrolase [Mesorhizobium sp. ArgA1]
MNTTHANDCRSGHTHGKLPREIAPGVWWLGDCQMWEHAETIQHTYSAVFLVAGRDRSLLVDTGHLKDWITVRDQLESLIEKGVPTPEWIFPTHPEVTHAGNLGRLLSHFPNAKAVGDLRDLHLVFPDFVDRFVQKKEGDEIDLGGRKFAFVEAVFRDLHNTLWGYDRGEQVMFTSDGLSFGHYHNEQQCGLFAEEIPDLPIPELTGIYSEYALYWTRFKNADSHVERVRQLLEEQYPTKFIASAHGNVVSDPKKTMPLIREGLRLVAAMRV